jgi:UDP-glucose 4-epimerase
VAPDDRDLNYDAYLVEGQTEIAQLDDFNSTNTRQLGVDELATILGELHYVRQLLDGGLPDEL